MRKFEFTAKDNKKIFVTEWECENPKGIVQISHGMAEHSGRYNEFAEFLAQNGYLVFADDHRAHGDTDKENLGYSDGDIFSLTLSDMKELNAYYKEKYNLPIILFGHSYGSFLAQRFVEKYPTDLSCAVIGGSAYMKGAIVSAGLMVANLGCAFKGKTKPAKLLKKITFDAYDKKLGGLSFISSVKEEVDRYKSDKYCYFTCSYNFYKGFFKGLKSLYKKNALKDAKGFPIMLIAGCLDPVGSFAKSVMRLAEWYQDNELNVKLCLQEGVHHEYLNDFEKAEAYEEILAFINKVIN